MRIGILMVARSGSTFMQALLSGQAKDSLTERRWPSEINCSPPIKHFSENYPLGHIINDVIMKLDSTDNTPELYSFYMPFTADHNFYNQFPGTWHFYVLHRDPRNRIESICQWAEKNPTNEDRHYIFREGVSQDKILLSTLLKLKKSSNFTLLPFEEFIKTPIETFSNIISSLGSELNKEYYNQLANEWLALYSNSGSNDKGKQANQRWLTWSEKEKKYFKLHCGEGLIALNYEEDNTW